MLRPRHELVDEERLKFDHVIYQKHSVEPLALGTIGCLHVHLLIPSGRCSCVRLVRSTDTVKNILLSCETLELIGDYGEPFACWYGTLVV